jgi:perosamine synthetase
MIPISKPLLGEEEFEAVRQVMASGYVVQGPRTAAFEEAFAQVCGVRYAVATSSGTSALHIALLAHGIGPGDEVITTPFTFIASASAILFTGARPVFVDVEAETFNIDPEQIEARITPRTRAILPVHLYGHPCEMDAIMEIASRHGLIVIEDAAQAVGAEYHGRRVGSFGTGCFSLYATKNVTSVEGGMITTDDADLADRARLLRSHGQRERYYHESLGYNLRMTDIQAAIGLVQLGKLEAYTAARQANAAYLSARLRGVITPTVRPGCRHVFHQYTIRVADGRDEAVRRLNGAGVGTGIFYPLPLHHQKVFRDRGYDDHLPVAERLAQEVISLPVHPALTPADLEQIVAAVNAVTGDR